MNAMIKHPPPIGGLLERLRTERDLVELLADDTCDVRIVVERRGNGVEIAVERDGQTYAGKGCGLVGAWRDFEYEGRPVLSSVP